MEARKVLLLDELPRLSGVKLTRKYTSLVDHFVRNLLVLTGLDAESLGKGEVGRISVLALGGYGSRELCFGSDVDLMILHEKTLTRHIEEALLHTLYGLWDAKLEVGYTIVTPREAKQLIEKELESLTAVISARLVLGSRALYRHAKALFFSDLERDRRAMFQQILEAKAQREKRFEKEEYLLEPDLKEGLGGLRDLDYMRWISRFCIGMERVADLVGHPEFSHFDINQLYHARGFLLKIRNYLHSMTGRKEDRLLLEYQKRLSTILGYKGTRYLSETDEFMKDVYLHMNRVRYATEEFLVKVGDILFPEPAVEPPQFIPSQFRLVKQNLVLRDQDSIRHDPEIILLALETANRYGLSLGSGLIWHAKRVVAKHGPKLVSSKSARRLFIQLITNPRNMKIIRLALELGLVCAFIPQFKRVRGLAQFGYYHVETVDLHSVRTLEIMGKIRDGGYDTQWPLLREVWQEIENTKLLFLAGLLHDIGKGYGRGHSIKGEGLVDGILENLGFDQASRKTVSFLVRHHLLLSRVSQRRDLGDEKTVIQVAQTIQDKGLLNMLFLLTAADCLATGPAARSEWKRLLLQELFLKVRKVIKAGAFATPDATRKVEEKREAVINSLEREFDRRAVEEMVGQVSTRYLLSVDLSDMLDHFRLALTMGDKKYAWSLKRLKGAKVTRILQCTHDMPGLFRKMVGVFTINNIKVLSANIFTLRNGLAFDIYEVTNPLDPLREKDTWKKIYGEIVSVLTDHVPLDLLVEERNRAKLFLKDYKSHISPRVHIDNEISDFFTVIEGVWPYSPGILFHVASKIHAFGLDIRFAKVNSDQEKMTGAFYVRDGAGQKIFEEQTLSNMRETLRLS